MVRLLQFALVIKWVFMLPQQIPTLLANPYSRSYPFNFHLLLHLTVGYSLGCHWCAQRYWGHWSCTGEARLFTALLMSPIWKVVLSSLLHRLIKSHWKEGLSLMVKADIVFLSTEHSGCRCTIRLESVHKSVLSEELTPQPMRRKQPIQGCLHEHTGHARWNKMTYSERYMKTHKNHPCITRKGSSTMECTVTGHEAMLVHTRTHKVSVLHIQYSKECAGKYAHSQWT